MGLNRPNNKNRDSHCTCMKQNSKKKGEIFFKILKGEFLQTTLNKMK